MLLQKCCQRLKLTRQTAHNISFLFLKQKKNYFTHLLLDSDSLLSTTWASSCFIASSFRHYTSQKVNFVWKSCNKQLVADGYNPLYLTLINNPIMCHWFVIQLNIHLNNITSSPRVISDVIIYDITVMLMLVQTVLDGLNDCCQATVKSQKMWLGKEGCHCCKGILRQRCTHDIAQPIRREREQT